MKHIGRWAGAWLLAVFAAVGKESAPGPNDITLSAPSAHIAWGKPLQGGSIRALFIAPRFTLRDAVELAERLDLEYETVALWDAGHAGCDPSLPSQCLPGAREEDVWNRLRALLKEEWGVILAANYDLSIMPEDIHLALADRVDAGAGLVLVHYDQSAGSPLQTLLEALEPADGEASILRGAIQAEPVSEDAPRVVTTALHGKGRVVLFHYPGNPPRTHCLIASPTDPLKDTPGVLEDAFSVVGRAVRWAAKRFPDTMIAGVSDASPAGPSEEEIPPDLPAPMVQALRDSLPGPITRPFRLDLTQVAAQTYEVKVQPRRPGMLAELSYGFETKLPEGASQYLFDLPIGAGPHILDIWLSDKKGVVDWFSQSFVFPGWPEFSNLTLSKEYLLPNDTLDVGVEVRGILNAVRSCTLYVRATDFCSSAVLPRGRLVAEGFQTVSYQGGHAQVHLTFADLIGSMLQIEVFAFDGDLRTNPPSAFGQAYRESRYIPVRLPRRAPEYLAAVSVTSPDEFNARQYLHLLSGLGISALHSAASLSAGPDAAENGLRWIPQVSDYFVAGAVDGMFRKPCLNDPDYRKAESARLQELARSACAPGIGLYSLGLGNCLVASDEMVCRCSHCMEGFRDSLQQKYGSLAALNGSWGAAFTAWEDIPGPDPGSSAILDTSVAGQDFRQFMDKCFAEFHGVMRESVRAIDREAQVGFRALPGERISFGYLWEQVFQGVDFVVLDPEPAVVQKVRAYRKPGNWLGLCFGDSYQPTPNQAQWLPWYGILNQFPMLWCLNPFGGRDAAASTALLLPDGRLNGDYQTFVHSLRAIQSGLGPVLLAASPSPSSIAVYASDVSRTFNAMDPACPPGALSSTETFQKVFEQLGYCPVFLTKAQLLSAEKPAYTVLVLPMARALEQAEVDAVARYAGQGGMIVADVLPGVFDEHGRTRADNPLYDLFGVVPAKEAHKAWQVGSGHLMTGADSVPVNVVLPQVQADGNFVLNGATALGDCGGVPIWCVRTTDHPETLLLNHPAGACPEWSNIWDVPESRQILSGLITGLASPLLADMGWTNEEFDGQVFRFHYGEAEMLAWLSRPDSRMGRQKICFRAPQNRYAYDMRRGTEIAHPKKAKLIVEPGDAALVAVLPYEIQSIRILTTEKVVQGQRLPIRISLLAKKATPGTHLLEISFAPRAGESLSHYRRIVKCEKGSADTFLALALNEPQGWYILTVRDILSGIVSSQIIQVLPGKTVFVNSPLESEKTVTPNGSDNIRRFSGN